jgi:multiple sugar transport system ATP-binding protein
VTDGHILIGDRDVTHLPPKDRDIAMVFQSYALYPHMNVAENMAFALKLSKVGKEERMARVKEAAKLLDLEPYLDRKPKALSGGQRQRVAMGRAIVRHPQVFCMDEPLSNLDAKLRVSTRTQIAALQQRLGITTLYVTHDQVEAMTMGDRVAVMKDGVLQQVDSPLKLYERPANVFVAGFIGSPAMNLLSAKPSDGGVVIDGHLLPIDRETASKMNGDVTVGVRPESWRLVGESGDGLPVHVTVIEELGADAYVYGQCDLEGVPGQVIIRVVPGQVPQKGETVHVTTDPGRVHVFDGGSGERLSA